jgi:hypothetical protein
MWFKLGMGDWLTALALWGNILAVLLGIIYGAIYWNRDNDQRGAGK